MVSSVLVNLSNIGAERARRERARLRNYYPDSGPLRRELYAKHVEFFELGATYKERLFMAANRVGKSDAGAFEVTCHLTGKYPHWWKGKRFAHPVEWWACGSNSETTRDIVQAKLMGPITAPGEGMIPSELIVGSVPRRSGLAGSIETAWVRHVSGGKSQIGFKTYEQGRKSFEGTAKHGIWNDEEPPEDCYTEMLYRTVTTRGIVLVTFTPLKGRSAVVNGFLEPENEEASKSKTFVQAGWDDVPHLDPEEKAAVLASTPAHEILARTKGEPSLGAGAIFPIAESEIVCELFDIPESWPRCYSLDVGWKRTACIWAARNPGSGQIVLYDEHYQGQGEPASHALSIKARGDWIPGVIDPAARGRSQIDGRELLQMYRDLGLKLIPANNAVEAGLLETWQLMVSGRLKVMKHLSNWLSEFRKYHRDEKGKIVKENDHLLDATRYLINSGRERMIVKPRPVESAPRRHVSAWS